MYKTINIKGKEYPVRVSYIVLKRVKEDTGKALEQVTGNDFEVYESLLYYALQQGAKAADKADPGFEKKDMEEMLDACFFEFVKIIPDFFPEGMGAGR
jgi:catalase